jgi:probable HAF family extracellular repeat protein
MISRARWNHRLPLAGIACLGLALFGFGGLAPAQSQSPSTAQSYTVVDLGTLGGTFSFGGGVNEQGWVNGESTLLGDQIQHAFLWRNGVMVDLLTLGGPNSASGFTLINAGVVAGASETSTLNPLGYQFCDFYGFTDSPPHDCLPFIWKNSVMTQLPLLEDQNGQTGNNGVAQQGNNREEIAGVSENTSLDPTCSAPTLQQRPVFWKNGAVYELPLLTGDLNGATTGINDYGQIVGFAGTGQCANEFFQAVLWKNGEPTDLGNLGGIQNNQAQFINNRGQVVGLSDLAGDLTGHAFLWQYGVLSDLSTLAGDFSSAGYAINDKNQIVGQSCDVNFNCRAFLWEDGQMTDVNTLTLANSPLYLAVAFGINSAGEITGLGITNTGEAHAFLAIPGNAGPSGAKSRPEISGAVRQLIQQRLHRGKLRVQVQ